MWCIVGVEVKMSDEAISFAAKLIGSISAKNARKGRAINACIAGIVFACFVFDNEHDRTRFFYCDNGKTIFLYCCLLCLCKSYRHGLFGSQATICYS